MEKLVAMVSNILIKEERKGNVTTEQAINKEVSKALRILVDGGVKIDAMEVHNATSMLQYMFLF